MDFSTISSLKKSKGRSLSRFLLLLGIPWSLNLLALRISKLLSSIALIIFSPSASVLSCNVLAEVAFE